MSDVKTILDAAIRLRRAGEPVTAKALLAGRRTLSTAATLTATLGTDGKQKYGCVMVPLCDAFAALIFQAQRVIDPADLTDKGYEGDPHITALWGLTSDDPDPIRRAASAFTPVRFRAGEPGAAGATRGGPTHPRGTPA